jgi:cytosine/adenosine deaminase-related metal-dependent hydrolase
MANWTSQSFNRLNPSGKLNLMAQNSQAFRARFVLPIDRPPIVDGLVVVSDGLISSVEAYTSKQSSEFDSRRLVDLGDVALIPALVNAHTHLEFSHFREPLGQPGIEFTKWIRQIVKARNQQNSETTRSEIASIAGGSSVRSSLPAAQSATGSKRSSILRGLAESYRCGVGCLGEIASSPVSLDDYRCRQGSKGLDIVMFLEQLGREPIQFPQKQGELLQFLDRQADSNLQLGISPHAPYSVHPGLLQQMIASSVEHSAILAMHLAESQAELELLANQTGPFVDLLKDFGIWDPASFRPQQSWLTILQQLARCARVLIVHGNYLNGPEREFIGQHRSRMSVVYCPRTHEHFAHAPYPLNQMRAVGVLLAVGTDSRASNPDLNLFAELQTLGRKFPTLNPLEIIEMGTLHGAAALGKADSLGSLSPGKLARLAVLEHPEAGSASSSDLLEWILDSGTTCRALHVTE